MPHDTATDRPRIDRPRIDRSRIDRSGIAGSDIDTRRHDATSDTESSSAPGAHAGAGRGPVETSASRRDGGGADRFPLLAVAAVVIARTALLLSVAGRYGWHRDELYYLAAGRHPAAG